MTRSLKPTVLFLENRSITDIWSGAANFLRSDFECQLLRFNRAFGGGFPGKIIDQVILAQPSGDLDLRVEDFIQKIIQTDRSVYLHGATKAEIRNAVLSVFNTLKHMKFDVVIGEVTSVYERAVEFYCQNNAIAFLAPMTTRIPVDRFFFLDGASLSPLPIEAGSSKLDLLHDVVEGAQRNVGRNDLTMALEYHVRFRNIFRTLSGWLQGERLHTPSPWRKAGLNWRRKRGITRLLNGPLARIEDINQDSVVYCMHVQPESTLDTYSPDLWDQKKIVHNLAKACKIKHRPFFVRPHPRGKHEIWMHLSEIHSPDVQILSPMLSMQDVLRGKPTIVTVSGTVLLEAAAAGVPTIALDNSYLTSFPGVLHVPLTNFTTALDGETKWTSATPQSQLKWFELINQFSHQGLISPPEWSSHALSSQNLLDISAAIRLAVNWCINQPRGISA